MSTGRAEGASELPLAPQSSPKGRLAGVLDDWLRCDAADPDTARDGRILAAILLVIITFAIGAFVLFVALTSAWLKSLPDVAIALVLMAVFVYNRRGNTKGAAIITLGFILVAVNSLILLSTADFHTQLNGALMWAPVIVLAGAILSWRAVLLITAMCVVNFGCIDYFYPPDIEGYVLVPRLAAMSIMLGFIGVLTAIIRHQASHYQHQLRVRNRELDRINASLESEVRARTHELETARDVALAAGRVKSQLLANINHELRTPMNAVLGMTEILLDTHLDDTQREHVQTVRDSGGNLLAIIDDILDFSELDAPSITVEEHAFHVRALVEAAFEVVAPAAAKKGLSLVTDIDAHVPTQLMGDAGRLRKVLDNLLSNAVRFTSSGEIKVRLEAEDLAGRVRLRGHVRDTGIGISEERVHHLFVPFGQLDASLTRRFGGTGLGLAICQRIVEHMGGRIGVESRLGEGSTFTFEVDLAPLSGELVEAPRFQSAAPVDPATPPGQYHALRILLAEDNVVNQKVAMLLLEKLGYSADVVANGREAVAAVEVKPYDVVLMDIQMPEMDGLQATRTIAVRVPLERRPRIIAVTAHTQAADKEQCLAVGMAELISKPLQLGMLRDALLRVPVPALS